MYIHEGEEDLNRPTPRYAFVSRALLEECRPSHRAVKHVVHQHTQSLRWPPRHGGEHTAHRPIRQLKTPDLFSLPFSLPPFLRSRQTCPRAHNGDLNSSTLEYNALSACERLSGEGQMGKIEIRGLS